MFTAEQYEAGIRAAFQAGFKKGLSAGIKVCTDKLNLTVRIGTRKELEKKNPKGLREIVDIPAPQAPQEAAQGASQAPQVSDEDWKKMSDNEKRSYLDREIDAYYC